MYLFKRLFVYPCNEIVRMGNFQRNVFTGYFCGSVFAPDSQSYSDPSRGLTSCSIFSAKSCCRSAVKRNGGSDSFRQFCILTSSGVLDRTKKTVEAAALTSVLLGGWQPNALVTRLKHRGGKKGKASDEDDEESDLEDEEVEEEEDEDDLSRLTFPEDKYLPNSYKEVKVHTKSARLDAIVSSGLNIARNKVDDYFLGSKLMLNGERVVKKSKQMAVGDYVDLVMSVEDGTQKVKRVRLLKVDKDRTAKDKLKITVRAWRTAFGVEDAGPPRGS